MELYKQGSGDEAFSCCFIQILGNLGAIIFSNDN